MPFSFCFLFLSLLFLQVAELALNKLFASLPSEDLVSTMLKLMAGTGSSDAAEEDDGEEPEMQQAAAARDPDQTTQVHNNALRSHSVKN